MLEVADVDYLVRLGAEPGRGLLKYFDVRLRMTCFVGKDQRIEVTEQPVALDHPPEHAARRESNIGDDAEPKATAQLLDRLAGAFDQNGRALENSFLIRLYQLGRLAGRQARLEPGQYLSDALGRAKRPVLAYPRIVMLARFEHRSFLYLLAAKVAAPGERIL
jgi:hypothetical protein